MSKTCKIVSYVHSDLNYSIKMIYYYKESTVR